MGNDTIGLYIKGFNMYGNVVEDEFKADVEEVNRMREQDGYVCCGDIFGRGNTQNFHHNYDVWFELSDYVTTHQITLEEITWEYGKILVLQFGEYTSDNEYFCDDFSDEE